MDTTTFTVEDMTDAERADAVRRLLRDEPGVARVLARPDRGQVYVKHSRAKAPRARLLERLEEEGYTARIGRRTQRAR